VATAMMIQRAITQRRWRMHQRLNPIMQRLLSGFPA
jgi:hypothetical protein